MVGSASRSGFCFEHDLFGKPVSTFPAHALGTDHGIVAVMQGTPHLLVVDDDREICELLSNFLAKHGFRVSIAHDARSMTQALQTGRISLVVLDLMLPGEDGLSLCRRLRATSTLPVVMLTAMSEETDRINGLEMGADDYLAKPFNPRELLARV